MIKMFQETLQKAITKMFETKFCLKKIEKIVGWKIIFGKKKIIYPKKKLFE